MAETRNEMNGVPRFVMLSPAWDVRGQRGKKGRGKKEGKGQLWRVRSASHRITRNSRNGRTVSFGMLCVLLEVQAVRKEKDGGRKAIQ